MGISVGFLLKRGAGAVQLKKQKFVEKIMETVRPILKNGKGSGNHRGFFFLKLLEADRGW